MEISGSMIRPTIDAFTDLGDGSHRFRYLHVDTLFTGTTSSTDTGHNHNDLYYLKSEVTTFLAAKASTSHTHAQYALITYVDDELALKADINHNHDAYYYRESEVDALLATKSNTSHNHDTRYYTESEIDARLDSLAGNSLDVTNAGGLRTLHVMRAAPLTVDGSDNLTLNYGVGLTVVSSQLRVDLAGIAGNGIEVISSKLHAKLGFGLEFDENNAIKVTAGIGGGSTSTVIAGDGLTGGGTGETITINVGAGFGINLDTNNVIVDTAEIIDTTKGLGLFGVSTNKIGIKIKTGSALFFDAGELDVTIDDVDILDYVDINYGLTVNANKIRILLHGASGMEFIAGALSIDLDTNSGLILSASGLKVDPGFGIILDGTGINVDTSVLVDTDKGMIADGVTDEIGINLAAQSGLEFTSGALRLDLDANAGLYFTGNNLAIKLATNPGLQLSSNELSVLVYSDGGLLKDSNGLSIKLPAGSGLSVNSFGLQLGTPSSVTIASTNTVSGSNHSHAITANANPGAASDILKTDSNGHLQIHRMGLNKTPDSLAALTIQTHSTSTYGIKIQQTASQTAPLLAIKNSGGSDVVAFTADGSLQSMSPVFVSGISGYKLGIDGTAEFNNIIARGEIRTAIFTRREVQVSGGSMIFATPGKVKGTFTANQTGSSTLDIYDPPNEHIRLFSVNDIIYIRAIGNRNYDQQPTHNRVNPVWKFWMPRVPVTGTTIIVSETWLKVTAYTDMGDFYRYTVTRQAGSAVSYPDSSICVNFGNGDRGIIQIVSDLQYAPYMELFKPSTTPWGTNGLHPILRLGRLDGVGLPELVSEQYGLVVGSDLRVQNTPRLVATNTQFKMVNIDIELYDLLNNKTVEITRQGQITIGKNIDSLIPGDITLFFEPGSGRLTLGNWEGENYVSYGPGNQYEMGIFNKSFVIGSEVEFVHANGISRHFGGHHFYDHSTLIIGEPWIDYVTEEYNFAVPAATNGFVIGPPHAGIESNPSDAAIMYRKNRELKYYLNRSGLKFLTNKDILYSGDAIDITAPAFEDYEPNYSLLFRNEAENGIFGGIEAISSPNYTKINFNLNMGTQATNAELPINTEVNIGNYGVMASSNFAYKYANIQLYTSLYLVNNVPTAESSINMFADSIYIEGSLQISAGLQFAKIATPANPPTDTVILYLTTGGALAYRTSSGGTRTLSYT